MPLAEAFTSRAARARSGRSCSVELEHDGLVGRGEACAVYYRGETVRAVRRLPERRRRRRCVGDDPFALEAIGSGSARRRAERRPRRRSTARSTTGSASGSACRVWRLLGLAPRRAAHLVHDRHRHASRARATGRGGRAELRGAEGQGRRRRRPRAARGHPRGVAGAAPGRRQRGLDARDGARADARAGRARRRVRRAALPGRRPGQLPRPARAARRACRSSSTRAATTCATWPRRRATPTASTSSSPSAGGVREALRMMHAARALGLARDARLHGRVAAGRRAGRAASPRSPTGSTSTATCCSPSSPFTRARLRRTAACCRRTRPGSGVAPA